jgi:hypothetical protein
MALKNPSVNCFRKFKRLQLTFQVVMGASVLSGRKATALMCRQCGLEVKET